MTDRTLNAPPAPRPMGAINWRGAWTLYAKEVWRFIKVIQQTVAAPMVTTLLFLAVFTLALGRGGTMVAGLPFEEFLAPGLVMMAMVQNAFANTSSSMVISKVQGNIVDVLMPPLSSTELTLAYALGGTTRGVVVGIATTIAMSVFVDMGFHQPLFILYHAIMASLMLSLLGLAGGIWADKFDHIAAVTNFVVTPLSFLSGTFYSISRLPEFWGQLALFNPFFYMIDGLRYGFTGHADGNVWVGLGVMLAANLVLGRLVWWMFDSGYKLRP